MKKRNKMNKTIAWICCTLSVLAAIGAVVIVSYCIHVDNQKKIKKYTQYAEMAVKTDTKASLALKLVEDIETEIDRGTFSWDDLDHYTEDYLKSVVMLRKPEFLAEHRKMLEDMLDCRVNSREKIPLNRFFYTIEKRVQDGWFSWGELGISEQEFRLTKIRCLGQQI
jgi:hypothetical protein